jgi:hypothetical protein
MNDPKPLLREGATDFERRLLSAALGERPSPRLQAQMRRGIGLTGPLVWAGNVKAMLGTFAGKTVIGAVGLVAAGGLAVAVNHAAVNRAAVSPAVSIPAAPTGVEAPSSPFAEQHPAAPALAPAASDPTNAGVAANAEATRSTAVAEATAAADDAATNEDVNSGQLREEIRLLDQARGALQRGSATDARSVLDEYRERFPAGILGREANVLLEQTRTRGSNHGGLKERGAPHRAH